MPSLQVTGHDPRFDRRIWTSHPTVIIGVILSLLVQFGTIMWWASSLSTRVLSLEIEHTAAEQRYDRLVDRIDSKLDRIDQRLIEHERSRAEEESVHTPMPHRH